MKAPKTSNKNSNAGEPIAAGGFGCVFKPALKCKDDDKRTNGISKMLTRRHANEEMDEIVRISPIIQKVPNNEDYFLISNIHLCQPDALTQTDVRNFNRVCRNLTRKGFTKENINTKLDEVSIINEPDGGSEIDDWLKHGGLTTTKFNTFNTAMIKLIKFGIIPMNKNKLFHFDVKSSNILMGPDDNARLIDWGLIGISTSRHTIPSSIEGRPIQFNVPFSSILFEPSFSRIYKRKLTEEKHVIKDKKDPLFTETIRGIAGYFYEYWKNSRGSGHEDYIQDLLETTYLHDMGHIQNGQELIFCNIYKNLVINQLTSILLKFTDFGKRTFLRDKYFTDVFQYNCDIWGALTTYITVLKSWRQSFPNKMKFMNSLRNILLTYLFSADSCSKRYNVDKLISELTNLSKIVSKTVKLDKKKNKTKKEKKKKKEKTKKASVSIKKKSSSSTRKMSFSWPGKRCPKGTRRNKRTGRCRKI
jgi:hypothetical protein